MRSNEPQRSAAALLGSFKRSKDVLDAISRQVDHLRGNPGTLAGLSSGFRSLDMVTGGFAPGSLTIVASRPGMGKTAFLTTIAAHAALRGDVGVAVFTLESPAPDLMRRFLSAEARVDLYRLRNATELSERDLRRLSDTKERLSNAALWIHSSPTLSIGELQDRARALAAKEELGLIMVDYLQLMSDDKAESRHEDVARSVRGLKRLALELNVPVVAASQVQRNIESRPNKRPMLGDLRESGAIEEVADVIIFIYRDEYYDPHSEEHGIAELNVVKQRHGPDAYEKVQFHGAHVRFNNLSRPEDLET